MALRRKVRDSSGSIGQLPTIQLEDGKLTEKLALSVGDKISEIITALNNGLSLGLGTSGNQAGNLDAQYITVLVPSVADTEFIIPHGLERVPVGYVVTQKDRACDVYTSSLGSWTKTHMYLKCDTGNATIQLLVW